MCQLSRRLYFHLDFPALACQSCQIIKSVLFKMDLSTMLNPSWQSKLNCIAMKALSRSLVQLLWLVNQIFLFCSLFLPVSLYYKLTSVLIGCTQLCSAVGHCVWWRTSPLGSSLVLLWNQVRITLFTSLSWVEHARWIKHVLFYVAFQWLFDFRLMLQMDGLRAGSKGLDIRWLSRGPRIGVDHIQVSFS